jgi:hypothetical protein
MYRISRNGHEPIINVDTVEQIEPEIPDLPAGRWHIDELPTNPFPSGHTSRRWGVAVKRADGSVHFLKSVLRNAGTRPDGSTIYASAAFLALGMRNGGELISANLY